jgi:NADPH:quinone reductase-like Zn-dependent oxidoreductase
VKALLVSEYTSVRSLRIQEVPSQEIAPEHVRVRVKAAGIGFVASSCISLTGIRLRVAARPSLSL